MTLETYSKIGPRGRNSGGRPRKAPSECPRMLGSPGQVSLAEGDVGAVLEAMRGAEVGQRPTHGMRARPHLRADLPFLMCPRPYQKIGPEALVAHGTLRHDVPILVGMTHLGVNGEINEVENKIEK